MGSHPRSEERFTESQTPAQIRFKKDQTTQKELSQTVKLADVKSEDYDTAFYVGGHGPMWDLAESPVSIALLESLLQFRQADRFGLSFARRASSRHLPGRAAREKGNT